jgi:plastocyanin
MLVAWGVAALVATTITAQDFLFDPPSVTIDVGETVTLDNVGGTHNFDFSDGEKLPAVPTTHTDPVWNSLSKTFDTVGTVTFHCDQHPGMTGSVKVVDPNAPTPSPTPSPTPTATPTPQPPQTLPAPLAIRRLRLTARTFCSRRSHRCRRPGVVLRIDVNQAAPVRGTLKRRGRAATKLDLGTVADGPRTLRFGRRLKPGRYTLRLRVGTLPARTLRFRIR